jgi:PAS domain S-box-containing protein
MTVYYPPEIRAFEPPEWGAPPSGARATWTVAIAGIALVIVTVIGVALVLNFVDGERERDLRAWQVRSGIVADSRFAAVNGWIDRQFGLVRDLAENASLQLYLTELNLYRNGGGQTGEAPPEYDYLRNLLLSVADAGGFSADLRGPEISANVERVGVAGIALLDSNADMLVATPGMPPIDEEVKSLIFANRGKRALLDLYLGSGGEPTIGFVAPVFAIQSNGQASEQIGEVIAIKEVGDELFPLLIQPGATETTAEAALVRVNGEAIEYLSPLADGTRPMRLSLAHHTAGLAAAFAVDTPGGFATRTDYLGNEVLVLSRKFSAAPWTLMYKVDTSEALVETDTRLRRMLTVLLLIVTAVAAALIATWRHGTSRRATEAAYSAHEMAERFEEQRDFLHLVTDSQPGAMAIIDHGGNYLWANRSLCENNGIAGDEIAGKHLSAVVGPVPAKGLLTTIRDTLESGTPAARTHSEEHNGKVYTYQSEFIPLPAAGGMPARVLMASDDITSAIEERAKRDHEPARDHIGQRRRPA